MWKCEAMGMAALATQATIKAKLLIGGYYIVLLGYLASTTTKLI